MCDATYTKLDIYNPVDDELRKILLRLNPHLEPESMAYHGLGHYQIIVRKDNLYTMAMMGGSNGYDCKYNEDEYKRLDIRQDVRWFTLTELLNLGK